MRGYRITRHRSTRDQKSRRTVHMLTLNQRKASVRWFRERTSLLKKWLRKITTTWICIFEAWNHSKQAIFGVLTPFYCTLTVIKTQKIHSVMHCNVFFNRLAPSVKQTAWNSSKNGCLRYHYPCQSASRKGKRCLNNPQIACKIGLTTRGFLHIPPKRYIWKYSNEGSSKWFFAYPPEEPHWQ
jgi:hypothetical protein